MLDSRHAVRRKTMAFDRWLGVRNERALHLKQNMTSVRWWVMHRVAAGVRGWRMYTRYKKELQRKMVIVSNASLRYALKTFFMEWRIVVLEAGASRKQAMLDAAQAHSGVLDTAMTAEKGRSGMLTQKVRALLRKEESAESVSQLQSVSQLLRIIKHKVGG